MLVFSNCFCICFYNNKLNITFINQIVFAWCFANNKLIIMFITLKSGNVTYLECTDLISHRMEQNSTYKYQVSPKYDTIIIYMILPSPATPALPHPLSLCILMFKMPEIQGENILTRPVETIIKQTLKS